MCNGRISACNLCLAAPRKVGTQMEILEGSHKKFDALEGNLTDKSDFNKDENPFHDPRPTNPMV